MKVGIVARCSTERCGWHFLDADDETVLEESRIHVLALRHDVSLTALVMETVKVEEET